MYVYMTNINNAAHYTEMRSLINNEAAGRGTIVDIILFQKLRTSHHGLNGDS